MYVCILIVSSRNPVCVKLQCLKYFEGFNVHLYVRYMYACLTSRF